MYIEQYLISVYIDATVWQTVVIANSYGQATHIAEELRKSMNGDGSYIELLSTGDIAI